MQRWSVGLLPVAFAAGLFFACWDKVAAPPADKTDAKVEAAPACTPTPLPPPTTPDADADAGDSAAEASVPPVGGACNCPKLSEARLGGTCDAVVAHWPDEGHTHFDPGTPIVYCTKPPSSGFHFWIWAAYKTYSRPVPAGYLVHAMEHGAVIVYYKCATSCPDTEKKLQAVIDALPIDKTCIDPDAGPPDKQPLKRRVILVPDPTLDVEVAAASWQWTYRATCVDATTLTAFVNEHYNKAAEDTCADGTDPLGTGPFDGGMD